MGRAVRGAGSTAEAMKAFPSKTKADRPPCPKCGSREVGIITFGLRAADWQPPEKPYEHLGCMPPHDDATHFCADCGHRWGSRTSTLHPDQKGD
jgi:hypothetical protein